VAYAGVQGVVIIGLLATIASSKFYQWRAKVRLKNGLVWRI
jgi:hypothetical protein